MFVDVAVAAGVAAAAAVAVGVAVTIVVVIVVGRGGGGGDSASFLGPKSHEENVSNVVVRPAGFLNSNQHDVEFDLGYRQDPTRSRSPCINRKYLRVNDHA